MLEVLAAAQKHVDNSISKTCNGAKDDTVESVDELYHLGTQLGCKAVSYYRDGSREGQVLNSMKSGRQSEKADRTTAEKVRLICSITTFSLSPIDSRSQHTSRRVLANCKVRRGEFRLKHKICM